MKYILIFYTPSETLIRGVFDDYVSALKAITEYRLHHPLDYVTVERWKEMEFRGEIYSKRYGQDVEIDHEVLNS